MKDIVFIDPGLFQKDIIPILKEDQRQLRKWGIQERSPFEWMNYLTEEVGELAKAISEAVYRDGDPGQISKEAIQVATLALKISKMSQGILGGKHEKF